MNYRESWLNAEKETYEAGHESCDPEDVIGQPDEKQEKERE